MKNQLNDKVAFRFSDLVSSEKTGWTSWLPYRGAGQAFTKAARLERLDLWLSSVEDLAYYAKVKLPPEGQISSLDEAKEIQAQLDAAFPHEGDEWDRSERVAEAMGF